MQAPIMWSVNTNVGVQNTMFFHLIFCILSGWQWQCWLPYDSFLSLGAPGMNCEGCYIPLALPPSQSNLALRLHSAEGELLTDRSSFSPLCLNLPLCSRLKLLSTAVLTSRDIRSGGERSDFWNDTSNWPKITIALVGSGLVTCCPMKR